MPNSKRKRKNTSKAKRSTHPNVPAINFVELKLKTLTQFDNILEKNSGISN